MQARAHGPGPRVAILVVNGFSRRGRRGPQRVADAERYPWIELCLRQVERHSSHWDYEVFAYDNSHLRLHRQIIERVERVHLWPSSWVAQVGGLAARLPGHRPVRAFERSHPTALDYLVGQVPEDFDYIVTLDNDSFPVRADWLDALVGACERGAAVAGVYRDEMAPDVHPFVHVSGLCLRRDELLTLGARFEDVEDVFGEAYKQNTDFTQDVGQKITYELIHKGRDIAPLKRSNKVNFHFLMGGIYGDVIYHQGAGGRRVWFRGEAEPRANLRISETLRAAAFADIDHLVAVLSGQASNDLDLTPI